MRIYYNNQYAYLQFSIDQYSGPYISGSPIYIWSYGFPSTSYGKGQLGSAIFDPSNGSIITPELVTYSKSYADIFFDGHIAVKNIYELRQNGVGWYENDVWCGEGENIHKLSEACDTGYVDAAIEALRAEIGDLANMREFTSQEIDDIFDDIFTEEET